jgi:hypothetical protein
MRLGSNCFAAATKVAPHVVIARKRPARDVSSRPARRDKLDSHSCDCRIGQAVDLGYWILKQVRSYPTPCQRSRSIAFRALSLVAMPPRSRDLGNDVHVRDPPGTSGLTADCRHRESIHPHATSWTNAFLAETLSDDFRVQSSRCPSPPRTASPS